MTIRLDRLYEVVEGLTDAEEIKLSYIIFSEKLTRGQKEQALMIAEYSINTAFRYGKFCENKKIIKCKMCGSVNIEGTRSERPVKKPRYEKRQGFTVGYNYIYTCMNCNRRVTQ